MDKTILVFDTEAAPIERRLKGVHPEIMDVYDFGCCVIDPLTGEELARANFAIADVFNDARTMANAFYSDKLPQYYEGMRNGSIPCVPLYDAMASVSQLCGKFRVSQAWAYNVGFDAKALAGTCERRSGGYVSRFFPANVRMMDIRAVAGRTVGKTKGFCRWAKAQGALTEKGNVALTVENVFRYLFARDAEAPYAECHTAMRDAEDEADILVKCLRYAGARAHADEWGTMWASPWRISRAVLDALED